MTAGLNLQKIIKINSHVSGPTNQWNATLLPFTWSNRYGIGIFNFGVCVAFYNRAITFLNKTMKRKHLAVVAGSTYLKKRPLGSFPNIILRQHWMGGFLTNYHRVKDKEITTTDPAMFFKFLEGAIEAKLINKINQRCGQLSDNFSNYLKLPLLSSIFVRQKFELKRVNLFYKKFLHNELVIKNIYKTKKNKSKIIKIFNTLQELNDEKLQEDCYYFLNSKNAYMIWPYTPKQKILDKEIISLYFLLKLKSKMKCTKFTTRKSVLFWRAKIAFCKLLLIKKFPSVIISTDFKGSNLFVMNEARRLRIPHIAPISSFDGYAGIPYFLPLGRVSEEQGLFYFILFYKAIMGMKVHRNSNFLFWRNW